MSRTVRHRLVISGRVQGVGFRPAVYAIAQRLKLTGWVANSIKGVEIEIEGAEETLCAFPEEIEANAPPLADIQGIRTETLELQQDTKFVIRESINSLGNQVPVTPDLAVCRDCLEDILDPENRRFQYPFTSCTNCGPRYSIINTLPYDRINTSMVDFPMCEACRQEYTDPSNSRFHAQPIACPECGPVLSLLDNHGNEVSSDGNGLEIVAEALGQGKVIALKGVGGFQFIVDASNNDAISGLREKKVRPAKPFAVMVQNVEQAESLVQVSDIERRYLSSPEGPIVLLSKKHDTQLSEEVAPGLLWLGIMLPTTPLHYLLLEKFGRPVVATSGNFGGEPLVYDNMEALKALGGICDLFLMHNRRITHPVDDSVIRIINDNPSMIRMARGYAPKTMFIKQAVQPLLATGSHQKSTLAIAGQGRITVSPHIGDLDTQATRSAYNNSASDLETLSGIKPEKVIHDLHPDYYSTRYAKDADLPCRPLQHHYAHAMSVIGEHGLNPDKPVFAVCCDGTGYASDGTVWGGEFLIVDQKSFKRFGNLRPFSLPGGEQAAREPFRSAFGILYEIGGEESVYNVFKDTLHEKQTDFMVRAIRNKVNSPLTTSAGRLFDGFSYLADICRDITYEGEAAIKLESLASKCGFISDVCELPIAYQNGLYQLDWQPLFEGSRLDAYKFHLALASGIVSMVKQSNMETVILTGGCFQNALLTRLAVKQLQDMGCKVYCNEVIPANDGGLSFGQAYWGVQS